MVHTNSKIAYKSIKAEGADQMHRIVILKAMSRWDYLDGGANRYERANTAMGIADNCTLDRYQVSRRMSELIRDGLVQELDVVYKPDNGRPQAVFQLTQKGVDCLEGGKL